MARKHDFVYYEADATMQFINPFVDLNVDNPTVAAFGGKSLKVRRLDRVRTFEHLYFFPSSNSRGCHARTPRSS